MSGDESSEPKLIIDEDWKTQVQREKELFKQKQSSEHVAQQQSDSSAQELVQEATEDADDPLQPPPPASFELMVSSLATQAVAAMGQLPGDDNKPLPIRPDYARHFIDLLGILETKTAGNLTDAEQKFLQGTLHQLRMLFISVVK